jgi:NADP-dependent 3-hydroxy acid dehydrogenase YdfG
MKDNIRPDEKVVVVTGASSVAGRGIALEIARHRSKLVLTARREEALNQLKKNLKNWMFSNPGKSRCNKSKELEDVAKAATTRIKVHSLYVTATF